jgi:predicted amidohydrolase YtcJ
MKRAALLALGFSLLPIVAPVKAIAQPDIVITHGRVFTNDPSKPAAEAIAIKGNTILAVGTNEQIEAIPGDANTKRYRLHGEVVIPGINDAHIHPGLGPVGIGLGTGPESTANDLAAALASILDETPPDLWILGTVGRTIMLDDTINRAKLDQLAPGRKVLIRSFTGHGMILSSKALQEAGVADNIPDPPGGRFGRNADGTLNGRVFEYAEYPIRRKVAQLTQLPGDLTNALRDFCDEAIHLGVTSVQAMPFDDDETSWDQAMHDAHCKVRVRHIFTPITLPPLLPRAEFGLKGTSGIKWILDGTPVEKGAALRGTYPDGGGSGQLNFAQITRLVKSGIDADPDQQMLFHAGGDKAVETLLKTMETMPGVNWPPQKVRIEHADGLVSDLDTRAKNLGVIAVLNPTHFFASPLYPPGFMRAKSLLAIPLTVAIGSDGPPFNPYVDIKEATVRADGNRREELTREEALRAYTLGSALAEMHDDKGVLAPGKLADLAVLSQNIFTVNANALPNTVSLLTIVGGKIALDNLQ